MGTLLIIKFIKRAGVWCIYMGDCAAARQAEGMRDVNGTESTAYTYF